MIIARNEQVPTLGGNMIAYAEIVKVTIPCDEYTMPKYEMNTGGEFVAL